MTSTQLWSNSSSRLVVNEQLMILEIAEFNTRLFFGRNPIIGKSVVESCGFADSDQVDIILQGIERSFKHKRNTCFEFTSSCLSGEVFVGALVQYRDSGLVDLHLIDLGSLNESLEQKGKASLLDNAVFENLPMSVDIYDHHGRLLDINNRAISTGLQTKESALGVSLFDNPNLVEDIEARLKAGESLEFRVNYDFKRLDGFVNTSKVDNRSVELEVSVTVVRDAQGEIDKYIVVSREMNDYEELKAMYESLNNRSSVVLDSIPVGISLYALDGDLLYGNRAAYDIFGTDFNFQYKTRINIFESPAVPNSIKQALSDLKPFHEHFGYDFSLVEHSRDHDAALEGERILDCKGRPVYGLNGDIESYLFVIEDATESLHKENLLMSSQRKVELAMQAADIMLWEFNVDSALFFSENEPLNSFVKTHPISIDLYINSIHPDERQQVYEIITRMLAGEHFSFCFDVHVELHTKGDWQYCTINGSPCESDDEGRVTKYVGTRKNNTQLHQQKHFYEKVLNEIPLSILIKDVEDDFRYVFCNKASKSMFGMTDGGSADDILDSESVARIGKTDLEVYQTGVIYKGLEDIVLNDGRRYSTIVQKNILENFGSKLLLSVRWDQTVQIALKRQTNLLNLSLEVMSAYTWLYEPDISQITFGDEFKKIGRNVEEMNTLEKYIANVHPDDRMDFKESLKRTIDQVDPFWNYQFRLDNTGRGDYLWFEVKGVLETVIVNEKPYTYLLGMTICIDDHRQIEEALREKKEELSRLVFQNELILNNAHSGLAYITTDYMVQWENISKSTASISFHAYEQGKICYKSAHNRNTPCERCVLERAIKSLQVERISFCLDNNRMVEVFATPVISDNGIVEGVVIRVDDITEREQMISELRLAKRQAEQSDKLKSAFLANMSHEIRTPLNAIVGFSELLVDASEEDKPEYSSIIKNNNDLLLGLINDILDLSKIESGTIELKYGYFDFSAHFNHLYLSMEQRIDNPDLCLITVNPYDYCRVYLDKVRVTQIVTNYVTNAIKYTPRGTIEMGYECNEGGIRIYVKDTGIGISEEKKSKVFHRFAKLDDFAQGTGLGLSICKATAELMGGSVGFETKVNEGSMFWVSLPCDPNIDVVVEANLKSKLIVPAVIIPTEIVNKRRTVLVAEDLPNNYLLISTMLRKKFNLVHAVNGKEAVAMFKNRSIDLVFMDMKMPEMDGMDAIKAIRSFNSEVPIVALTAHAFEADRVAALAAGCNDYLVKPIDQARLMAVLLKYGLN